MGSTHTHLTRGRWHLPVQHSIIRTRAQHHLRHAGGPDVFVFGDGAGVAFGDDGGEVGLVFGQAEGAVGCAVVVDVLEAMGKRVSTLSWTLEGFCALVCSRARWIRGSSF